MDWQSTSFQVFRYSLRSVEQAIGAGCVPVFEDAIPTQYDRFFSMAGEYGVLAQFAGLTDTRKNPCVPVSAVSVLMVCRFLRAIQSFREMGQLLLRYRPLLERLGFSMEVCEKGVYRCQRMRNAEPEDAPQVFDPEVFSEVLRDLDREELNRMLADFVQALWRKHPGLFRDGQFAMDSNSFRVAGYAPGQKWCALMLVTRYGMIPVAMEFSATEGEGTGETSIGRRLLERVLTTYGREFLKRVLMDAGYLDGESQRWLKFEQGIDWMLPTKEKMVVTNYMLGAAQEARPFQWRTARPPQLGGPKDQLPTRKVLWIEDIPHFPEYGAKVNGIVIRDQYPPSALHPEGKVTYQCIVTSDLTLKGAEIHDLWRKRWCIENAFGFMTDVWGLGKWQIRNLAVYQATIQYMALTYGLHILMQAIEAKPQTLGQLKRRFEWQAHNMVIIRAGDACAILTPQTLNDWMARGILTLRAP